MLTIPKTPRRNGLNPDAEPAVVKDGIRSSASARSGNNDMLSQNEVLQRAQYWVDQGFIHGQPDAPDSSGHRYCSDGAGLVANAWRLAGSPPISHFLTNALNGAASMRAVRLDDVRPGDALIHGAEAADGDNHIALFAFWKDATDLRKGAYVYSFRARGETVRNPYALSNLGNLGFDDWSKLSSCISIRYDNILEMR